MRTFARIIKFFFVFVALLLIALLAFVATFDANNYKPEIIAQVEKATGRDFVIDGEIKLSVFPWVGLKVEDAALGNEAGFQAKQFAAIKQLDIKVNVLPLLNKQVEVNTIRLHGLNISLEVEKDGSNNWSQLAQAETETADAGSTEKAAKVPAEPASVEDSAGLPLQSLKVEGFELVDAVVVYDDRSSNTRATVSELNLKTGEIQFDQPVKISFAARVENNQPAIDTRLNLKTQLSFNKDFTVFNLRDLVFTVLTNANEFIPQKEQLEIRSNIDVLMDDERITVKQLKLSALDTTTLANITVSQFLQTPLIQGDVEVQPFNARKVAKRLGVDLPEMAKADALHKVAIKTKIELQGEVLQANDFSLLLDGNTLSGWLHVIDISKQQLRYDLAFDQLNLNDYLPPVSETVANDKMAGTLTETGGATTDGAVTAEAEASGDEKIELPLEMMRQLDVQGDLRIASLTAMEYDIKQFLMSTKASQGEINIKPLSMQLLEGQVSSAINMDVTKQMPAYKIDLEVNQLQVGPVVNPFLDGIMGDKPLAMEGAVNMTMNVKTTGETINQLKRASLGQIVIDMKETAVKGFDPEFYMRSSVASYLDEKGFGLSQTVTGNYRPRQVTVFDTVHSTVNLKNGKARTDDFLMDSERVQVAAKGFADIVENTLDVTSSVKLARDKTALEKVLDDPLFVRIHGPFDALSYDLDTDRLKKSTSDVLEKEAKARLDAEKQRLQEKVDAEKKRLEEKVEEERRRAEEKARQELKDSADEYKDKLKDKLKGLF